MFNRLMCIAVVSASWAFCQSTGKFKVKDLEVKGKIVGDGGTSGISIDAYGNVSVGAGVLNPTALSTPAAPTVSHAGTAGAATWTYFVQCRNLVGMTVASTAASTTTGNATLDVTNYNIITPAALAGASTCDVWRSASGGTPATVGLIGSVAPGVALNDTGLTGDNGTIPGIPSYYNSTAGGYLPNVSSSHITVYPSVGDPGALHPALWFVVPVGSDPGRTIAAIDDMDHAMPYRRIWYLDRAGNQYSGAQLIISNKRLDVGGAILGIKDSATNNGCCMIGSSPDINGTVFGAESHSSMSGGYENQLAFAAYDLSDVWGGATGYGEGYGKKKWGVSGNGTMLWGTNLGSAPLTNAKSVFAWQDGGFIATGGAASTTNNFNFGSRTIGITDIEIGSEGTGNQLLVIDLHTSNTSDYDFRIFRGSGANGGFTMQNRGTGVFDIQTEGAGALSFSTTAIQRMVIAADGTLTYTPLKAPAGQHCSLRIDDVGVVSTTGCS